MSNTNKLKRPTEKAVLAKVAKSLARMKRQGIVLRGVHYENRDGRKIPVVTFETR